MRDNPLRASLDDFIVLNSEQNFFDFTALFRFQIRRYLL
jgi:hypothetical protein